MGLRINTNVVSLAAQRTLGRNNSEQGEVLGKLASGSRINKSADDAAGLAISEKMRAQIRSTNQANRNANDAVSLIQTSEGGLSEVSNIIIRLRELAIQSSSDTLSDRERAFTDLEFQNLKQEIQRISQVTEFNGKKLLDGQGEFYDFQIGINNSPTEDRLSYDAQMMNSSLEGLGLEELAVNQKENSRATLAVLDNATHSIAGQRALLGAMQNRLQSTSRNLQTSVENLSTANSRIRDTDYAEATAKNTQLNILTQSGTSVLSQANLMGQQALKLLG